MLMTARADRGPQWDIGTQMYVVHDSRHFPAHRSLNRFMVDTGSDLYYDPAPLTGKEQGPSDKVEQPDRSGHLPHTPQRPHPLDTRSQHPHPYQQQQLGMMHGQMQNPNMPQHHPGMMGHFPAGSPYGMQQQHVPPDQFYGGGSPMHMRQPGMGGMPQDHTPDMRRRVTRAMSDEYQMHGM